MGYFRSSGRLTPPNQLVTFTLVFLRPGVVECGREAGKGGSQQRDIASYKPPTPHSAFKSPRTETDSQVNCNLNKKGFV